MKKITMGFLAAGTALGLVMGSSPALAYTGPNSWSTAGLQEVARYSGQLSWSVDGLGTLSGDGTIQVNKPAGGLVGKAFFMAGQAFPGSQPTLDVPSSTTLNGKPVTFSYESLDAGAGYDFNNYFADVTDVLYADLTAAPEGMSDVAVHEGGEIEGTALIVLWIDPSVDAASVVIAFGNSDPAGDSFTLAFPALTQPQTEDLQLSMGITYSYQDPGEDKADTQASTVVVNGTTIADMAGGFDDCNEADPTNCFDGSLATVGGIGNSTTNVTVPGADPVVAGADDELFTLSPLVNVGDTSITVSTTNASNDDNIFFDAFYLKRVTVADAVQLDAYTPTSTPTLPNTGVNAGEVAAVTSLASLALLGGFVAWVAASRRRRA